MLLPRAVGIHLKSLKWFFTMKDQGFNANSKGERIIHRWDLRSLSLAKKKQANHEQTWMLSRFWQCSNRFSGVPHPPNVVIFLSLVLTNQIWTWSQTV